MLSTNQQPARGGRLGSNCFVLEGPQHVQISALQLYGVVSCSYSLSRAAGERGGARVARPWRVGAPWARVPNTLYSCNLYRIIVDALHRQIGISQCTGLLFRK
eukprot:7307768-Prymnesium_polylepis.1